MRKINGKLFLALLLGTLVLGGGVFGVHYLQYHRIARALFAQSERASEEGKTPRQVEYLKRYLEFNPLDIEAKIKLAGLWAGPAFANNIGARNRAVRLLDEVLGKAEDRPDLRRLLVKTALEARNFKIARDHLGKLLPEAEMTKRSGLLRTARTKGEDLPADLAAENADMGELEGFWGQLLEGENKSSEALNCYRLSFAHAPHLPTNAAALAFLLHHITEPDPAVRKENVAEADRVVATLIEKNADVVEALLTRWRYRRSFDLIDIRESAGKGQVPLEKAAEDVTKSLKIEEGNESVEVLLAGADLERLRGRVALEDIEKSPKKRWATMLQHRAAAEEFLTRGLTVIGKQPKGIATDMPRFQLLWHKSNLLLDDLDRVINPDMPADAPIEVAQVKSEIEDLITQVKKSVVPAAAEYLAGRLLVNEQRWADAAARFEQAQKLLTPQPDLAAQADLYLGQCYGRMGEGKQMYDAYRRVLDRDPGSVAAPLGMAAALTLQGRLEEARVQYRGLIALNRLPSRGWFDVAHLEMQYQAQQDKPNWKDAEEIINNAEKANRGQTVPIAKLRVELALRRGKPELAKTEADHALETQTKEPEFYAVLSDVELRKRNFDESRKILARGEKVCGDKPALRLARARLISVETDKSDEAAVKKLVVSLNELAVGCEKLKEDEQASLLKGLAESLVQAGASADARAMWERVATLPRQKGDLGLRLLLFDLALKANDEPGMDRCLEDIRHVEQSSGSYHHYGKALKMIWQAQRDAAQQQKLLAEARVELDHVQTQRPSWAPIFLARGEIARLTNARGQEIGYLEQALQNGENSALAVIRLVELLTQDRKYDQAHAVLQRHEKLVRTNRDVAILGIGIAIKRKEAAQALKLARALIRDDSKNPEELMLLADALHAAKEKGAEDKYDTAIRYGGKYARPWLRKLQFLIDEKRATPEVVKELMERMKEKLDPKAVVVAEGDCYMLLRQWDKAEAAYEEALKAQSNDPVVVRQMAGFYSMIDRLDRAEALLRQIVDEKVKSSPADRAWARRELADVLSRTGLTKNRTEALELVGLALDSDNRTVIETSHDDNIETRRARTKVLARQPQKRLRQKAIDMLEAMRSDRVLEEDDLHRLAQLYRLAASEAVPPEKPTKARRQYEELVTRPRLKPQYLADYVSLLLTDSRTPGKLDDSEKEEVKKLLETLQEVEGQFGLAPNAFGRVELEARFLETSGAGDKALSLLREYARRKEAKPEDRLLELSSLARQEKIDDAFGLLESAWKDARIRPDILGGASVALSVKLSDKQVTAVEKHLQDAIGADDKSTALRMQLAELYGKRKRFDDAEKAYREVLARDSHHVVALNNLAWLLATRSENAKEALDFITRAVDGLGNRVELLDTRGVVYLALKEPEKALSDLKEATAEAPTPNRLFHLGWAHHLNKDSTRARQVLREAWAKGLRPDRVHPTEKTTCEQLLTEYNVR
jgi:cellulose synthase operon protein C